MDAIDRAMMSLPTSIIAAGITREELAAAIRAAVGEPVGWISCAERMPEAGREVLVWHVQLGLGVDMWDEQYESPVSFSSATLPVGLGWDGGWEWEDVTHWMPAPSAPDTQPKSAK